MSECLVTKLKASVADDSLRVLGELRFAKRANIEQTLESMFTRIYPGADAGDIELTILNDGYFCNSNAERDESMGKTVVCQAGINTNVYISLGSIVRINPKYNLKDWMVNVIDIDIAELSYTTLMTQISLSGIGIRGNIEVFKNHILTSLRVDECNYQVYGNLEEIKDLSDLTFISVTKTHVTGNISKCFGNSLSLNTLRIADSDMTGSLEDFVSKQIAGGRTNATIKLPYAKVCKGITYKGVTLNMSTDVPSLADGNQFSWTSDGTITWS